MGRPLSTEILISGENKIPVLADLGSGPVNAWLVSQRASNRYIATDGSTSALVQLQAEEPSEPGQAYCVVNTLDGDKPVRQINRNDVKTWDGNTYKWLHAESPEAGQGVFAPLEEEGKIPGVPEIELYVLPSSSHGVQGNYTNDPGVNFAIRTFGLVDDGEPNGLFIHVYENDVFQFSFEAADAVNGSIPFIHYLENETTTVRAELRDGPLQSDTIVAYAGGMGPLVVHVVTPTLTIPNVSIPLDDQEQGEPNYTSKVRPTFIIGTASGGLQTGDVLRFFVDGEYHKEYTIAAEDDTTAIIVDMDNDGDLPLGAHMLTVLYRRGDDPIFSPSRNFGFAIVPA